MPYIFYSLVAALAVATLAFWIVASIEIEDIWSIGIYSGPSPLQISPHSLTRGMPVLTAADVADAKALFVADPFLIRDGQRWLLFFEFMNAANRRGEIAYAASEDGTSWRFQSTVLREPFHLSYPQIFEHGSEHFMIPETGEAGAVRLYKAERFPEQWTLVSEILQGHFLDASVVRHGDSWWLFALRDDSHLALYHATELTGPWLPHPSNPIVTEPARRRPGGRIVRFGDRLIRFSQDGRKTYGHQVTASEIVELTHAAYKERVIGDEPVICASGRGWNADGMHHVDAQELEHGQWLAAVDGKVLRRRFNGRRGARAVLNYLGIGRRRAQCSPAVHDPSPEARARA